MNDEEDIEEDEVDEINEYDAQHRNQKLLDLLPGGNFQQKPASHRERVVLC